MIGRTKVRFTFICNLLNFRGQTTEISKSLYALIMSDKAPRRGARVVREYPGGRIARDRSSVIIPDL